MKTLTQHIEERLLINKNFKQRELFKPHTVQELKDYINSSVDELIKNNDDFLDMSNIDLSLLKLNSSDDHPLYKIFTDPCQKIRKINITVDVTDWNVNGFAKLDCVFYGCVCIETIRGLETWDVSSARDFAGLFSQCEYLKNVNVSGWKLKSANTIQSMFYNCEHLTKIDGIDTWEFADNRRVKMSNMFYKCRKLNDIGDIEYWKDFIGNTDQMFYKCDRLTPPTWYHGFN